ncbi:hypothetical protein J3R30DRAFT_1089740 [Lentinula aciculospora]|uniref:Uncharacterized protein n=1 Tax=Lentinula aciculospora TaxID=153920 RepID=A0A9W9A097_9AGAR|nr:hypothetical protein J3R30DRAFT_1089740 [Lentinula aciculospora]
MPIASFSLVFLSYLLSRVCSVQFLSPLTILLRYILSMFIYICNHEQQQVTADSKSLESLRPLHNVATVQRCEEVQKFLDFGNQLHEQPPKDNTGRLESGDTESGECSATPQENS